jgi:hypothetical protein
LEEEV